MKRGLITIFFIMGILSKLFGAETSKQQSDFPPIPEWEPEIKLPEDKVIDRFRYYTDGKKDFVVFAHSTCVVVSDGLSDDAAKKEAVETLSKIFNYHPDMKPLNMDDGNVLVQYNHPAYNVVLDEVTKEHMKTIRANHQRALARAEVLMTPLGQNKFDDFGMKALFGRCYFFMDAKKPVVSKIVRKSHDGTSGAPNPSQPSGSNTNRAPGGAGSAP